MLRFFVQSNITQSSSKNEIQVVRETCMLSLNEAEHTMKQFREIMFAIRELLFKTQQ